MLLMPLALVLFCNTKKIRTIFPLVFLGFLSSAVVCGFKGFFMFAHRVIFYSFIETFASLFVFQTLLPLVIVYGVFFFISHDEFDFKLDAFVPLILSFYCVYMPFTVMSEAEAVYSGFEILIKPSLYAAMIVQTGFLLPSLVSAIQKKNKNLAVLISVGIFIYLVVPSLLETFYLLYNCNLPILFVSALYVAFVFFYLIATKRLLKA